MVNVSLPSSLSTLTVEPIWTWSVEWFSSMIVGVLDERLERRDPPLDECLLVLGVLVLRILA